VKVKVVTIPFDESEGFDDDLVQGALEGREVVSVTDHFFVHGGRPWLCLVVQHTDGSKDGGGRRERHRSRDWAADLDDGQRQVFEALRAWRRERATADGIPVYIVATNRQLAEIVKRVPAGKSDLQEVPGLGREKVRAFGDQILEVVRSAMEPDQASGGTGEEGEERGG